MSCSHTNKTERIKACNDPNCDEPHPHVKIVCADCGFEIGDMA